MTLIIERHSILSSVLLSALIAGCSTLSSTPAAPATANPTLAPTPISPPIAAAPDEIARLEITDSLYAREIQSGVFVITDEGFIASNSLAAALGEDTLLLVDTPWTPEATESLVLWLEARFGEREIVAINTHFHEDRVGGNAYLAERGATIYGSTLTASLLEQRDNETNRTSTPPSTLFDIEDGLTLELGGETVQGYFPGAAHSADNIVVYFPARRLLYGGDMIIGLPRVGNTTDADLSAWPRSLENLQQFTFDTLVPGHGDRLDPGLLDHTRELLENFES